MTCVTRHTVHGLPPVWIAATTVSIHPCHFATLSLHHTDGILCWHDMVALHGLSPVDRCDRAPNDVAACRLHCAGAVFALLVHAGVCVCVCVCLGVCRRGGGGCRLHCAGAVPALLVHAGACLACMGRCCHLQTCVALALFSISWQTSSLVLVQGWF